VIAVGANFLADAADNKSTASFGSTPVEIDYQSTTVDFLIAPGALFHAARAPSTLMRINFTTTQDTAFWGVYRRLVAG
jgi:hypothetical protein